MKFDFFDSGKFRVAVPDGWLAFCGIDSEGKTTPKTVHVYKDCLIETDIFTHVGLTFCFFGKKDYYLPTRFFYDNVSDIDPVTIGAYTWNGYTCTSLGYPYTMLETENDGRVFKVMILMKNGDHELLLTDPEVQNILESLALTDETE